MSGELLAAALLAFTAGLAVAFAFRDRITGWLRR